MIQRTYQPPIDAGRLIALVDAFEGRRVAVFGDLIVDEFIYGEIARVSREAPVLILNYDSTEIVAGGAGNAASNVAALGGKPSVIGIVGRDEPGQRLMHVLRGMDVAGVARPAGYRTPTKTRILAGGIHSAKQQVVRIDRASAAGLAVEHQAAIAAKLARAAARCDALLVSPQRRQQASEAARPGTEVIEFVFTPDRTSVNNLKVALLELENGGKA